LNPTGSTTSPGQPSSRKRLGQFFTGQRVARLLAELAGAASAKRICDPMAGTGDMLEACLAAGAEPKRLDGVEIDSPAFEQCVANLRAWGYHGVSNVVHGDAFSPATWCALDVGYDLVITNPPYVRYQSMAVDHAGLPHAGSVRAGLIETISGTRHLDTEDKDALISMARQYSGHADLLLPSWLLCVSILQPGGTLAMVLPESFLSRNYAAMAWYSLLRWFDLQFVVQDVDSCWFEDAQVRTALVVAKRVPRRPRPLEPAATDGHSLVRLGRDSASEGSVVGSLYDGCESPERAFADDTHRLLAAREDVSGRGLDEHWVPAQHMADMVATVAGESRWVTESDRDYVLGSRRTAPIPVRMHSLVKAVSAHESPVFDTLKDCGWSVSQGLRTGANDFFYLEQVEDRGETEVVRTSALFGQSTIEVPSRLLRPVLKRQSELPQGRCIDASKLDGRVLVLEDDALPEDIASALRLAGSVAGSWADRLRPLTDDIESYVREGTRKEVLIGESRRLLRAGSAVATNTRTWSASRPELAPRFWYMLPPLRDRHTPSLAVARVQGVFGGAYLNDGRQSVIDANFSTLWPTAPDALDIHTMLAVLSSSWVSLHLELTAAVMGGGALKVEATHLRRIVIPRIVGPARRRLHSLGLALASGGTKQVTTDVTVRIDREMARLIADPKSTTVMESGIQELLQRRRSERSGGAVAVVQSGG